MTKRVFISYRRTDTQMTAGRLHDGLVRHFSSASVFRDKEALRPGHDWVDEIQRVLGENAVVVALIGPQWINARDAGGRRRLDDADDTNRVELETALAKQAPVIPVLVEGATMPVADDLPEGLRALTRRHALRLRDDDWDADFARLASALSNLGIGVSEGPVNAPTTRGGDRTRRATLVAAVAGLALVAVSVWLWFAQASETTVGPTVAQAPAPVSNPTALAEGSPSAVSVAASAKGAAPSGASASSPADQKEQALLRRLAGVWNVTQTDSVTRRRIDGTLSLRAESGSIGGTLAWEGLAPANVTSLEVSGRTLTFTVVYPGGVNGTYMATVDDAVETLREGRTQGSGNSKAEWSGRRSAGLSALTGRWDVTQKNGDGSVLSGTLTLSMADADLTGVLAWKDFLPAKVINARLDGRRFRFTADFPGDLASGEYEATVDDRGQALIDGFTQGGGATAKWSGQRDTSGRGR